MADAASRFLPVRNPRTGAVDFELPVTPADEVAAKAKRMRENQVKWAALSLQERMAIMGRWLGAVRKRVEEIGEADAVDTGGCHTSYIQGYITMGNIGGW